MRGASLRVIESCLNELKKVSSPEETFVYDVGASQVCKE
ncbi:hypothetical protein BAT_1643 [Bacillus pumilus ATCC 7061]|nr:hypothetical protein BAT_1643 [Bacillus pumilus ATCC 7061]